MHTAYVLRSLKSGRYYKGFTSRPMDERLAEHNRGFPPGWSAKNRPFELAYMEQFESEADARARERFFKSGRGREWLKSRLAEHVREPEESSEP
jgi:putative endonuclease